MITLKEMLTPNVSPKKLFLYRLIVRVQVEDGTYRIINYWVEAPTQCSAAKHTALRPEVDDISYVGMWLKPLPEGATLTFSTTAECP